MIPPGSVLGVVGGGQLGRMFTVRAREMGYRVVVLEPDLASPAGAVAERHLAAQYGDIEALDELASQCDAVTTEFENVPAHVLEYLAARVPVRPGSAAVEIAQDRNREKAFLVGHGIPTVPYSTVDGPGDLESAARAVGFPARLKTTRLGYDGKGQALVQTSKDLEAALGSFRGRACVLERQVDLELELSVVLARSVDGQVASFPPVENVHVQGILDTATAPARIDSGLARKATDLAMAVAEALEYVGVLAVELFVADGQQLFVNELAPRPHNSGHFTLDACVTDQFEQQVRTLCQLPLGDPRLISPVTMINLLGELWLDGEPAWEQALTHPGVKLHLYGKKHPRRGRKMGHLNCLAEDPEASLRLAILAREALVRVPAGQQR